MKIVDRKTFLSLPAGTVFRQYTPCCFGPISIKGETWSQSNDFISTEMGEVESESSDDLWGKLERAEKDGQGIPLDFYASMRDGMFGDDQLFAVWESRDVLGLIQRLCEAHEAAYDK